MAGGAVRCPCGCVIGLACGRVEAAAAMTVRGASSDVGAAGAGAAGVARAGKDDHIGVDKTTVGGAASEGRAPSGSATVGGAYCEGSCPAGMAIVGGASWDDRAGATEMEEAPKSGHGVNFL